MKKQHIFWALVVFMHLLAFGWATTNVISLRDSDEYLNAAASFSKNGSFYCFDDQKTIDFRGFTKRPALYPIILQLLEKHWFILLFQNLLSIFNLFIAFKIIGYKSFEDISKKGFLLLCLVMIFSFSQFIYANLIMADLLLQTFTLLIILALIKCWEKLNGLRLIFLVGLVILALLTKPVVTFWIYILPVVIVTLSIIQKKRFKTYVIFFMISLLPIVVYEEVSHHNEQITGLKHFSSISDINLLHYNTRYLLIKKYGNAQKADEILAPLMIETPDKETFTSNSLAIRKACKDLILDNKWRYLKIHTLGAVRMLVDPGRFDLYQFLKVDSDDKSGLMEKSMKSNGGLVSYFKKQPLVLLLVFLMVFLFNIIKLFFFVKFIQNKQITLMSRLVVLGFVLYFVGITGPIGASRFLLPVLPLLVFATFYANNDQFKDSIKARALK